MKNLFFALVLFMGLPILVYAQPKIEFEKQAHDFGTIKEEQGQAEVTFRFKNTGTEALKLTNVRASCGCTTPEWSKDEVKPNETGFIKAVYNAANRPGKFDKSITVQSNATNNGTVILRINGEVTPRKKNETDWYPSESGNIRMRTSYISFGDVWHDGTDTASTVLYNAGNAPIKIDLQATKLPTYVTMKAQKTTLKPKETAVLDFTFDATKIQDWGHKFTNFNLVTDDTKDPNKRINISAQIKENFAGIAKENAPKVKFDKLTHNFGKVAQNDRVSTTFTISNEGKSPLVIRKTKASCGCTASKPQKMTLAPGESTPIEVTFSSGTREGTQKKSVTVICNDPNKPETRLYIESDVQKDVARTEKSEEEGTEITTGEKVITQVKTQKESLDLTRKSVVKEGAKVDLTEKEPIQEPISKKIEDYNIGQKVARKIAYKGKPVEVIGFVEGQSGDKIQVRIADTGGKRKLEIEGIQLKENLVIWDSFINWDVK